MVQFDVDLNGGGSKTTGALVRYTDHNGHYRVSMTSSAIGLYLVARGKESLLASGAVLGFSGYKPIKIKLSGTSIKVWYNGSLTINTTDSTHAAGGFGLSGDTPRYQNILVGYDNNADDDIDDAGDDIVYDDDYSGTDITVAHDNNGNLTDDGTRLYEYDAWNRLTKVKTQHDNLTLATYSYDALGRRIKKVVTNSEPFDGTSYYYYNSLFSRIRG